jgi:uncharacterized sporulation protein YeaH/YhbH (DUF444 family)
MATTPTSTTFIFVDRRKTGRGKSLNNRQKLLKRVKDSIKNAKPEDIDAGGVGKAGGPQGAGNYTNPVKVARHALSEPTFHYDPNIGEREIVLIGNDHWLKGDEFPINPSGGSGGRGNGNGPGEEGEDDFIVNISRSEFFDVFFEDCELPDLKETHEKDLPEFKMQRAGFQKVGNPGQLSVIRSFKHSKARRLALTKDSRDELAELEAELAELMADDHEHEAGVDAWALRVQEVALRIAELKQKVSSMPIFEDVDLRYRKSEKVQVKASDAVLGMIMDVSGSMDEDKKRMARKFFSLQYAFIKRKYPTTDLIFIAHTDEPHELSEEEFFTTRLSGGTTVSPAWAMMHDIIKSRYDANQTNIYLSYAGDGDNWDNDNANVIDEIETKGLLAKVRHAVYVQVGQNFAASFGGSPTLWNVMMSISNTNRKLACVKIADEAQVFDAFKSLYGKKKGKK